MAEHNWSAGDNYIVRMREAYTPNDSNDQKPGKLPGSATMQTQNAEIATTLATNQKRRVPDPPKSKSKRKVFIVDNKNGEGLNVVKIRTQNAEIAKTPKGNAPDPPQTKPKPSWRREPVNREVYNQNKEDSCGEEKQQFNKREVGKASSIAKMNIQEFKEKVKKLQEEFSSMPNVLLKKTLGDDDVNGDLAKARQLLQESKQISNIFLKRTNPMANQPGTENPKRGKKNSSLRQSEWKPNNDGPGDTSSPAETSSGLNPTPGNQRSTKNLGPSIKNTAFEKEPFFQISDFINNNDQKPGKVSDSATMQTQNAEIATAQKRRTRDPTKPKSKRKVFIVDNKNGEALNAVKIRTQNAEMGKTPKWNAPDPSQTKPKPSWRRESKPQNEGQKDANKHYMQVHEQSYEQEDEDYKEENYEEGDYEDDYELQDGYEEDYDNDHEDDYEDYDDKYEDEYEEDYDDNYEDGCEDYDDDYEEGYGDNYEDYDDNYDDYEEDYGDNYDDYEEDYGDDYEDFDDNYDDYEEDSDDFIVDLRETLTDYKNTFSICRQPRLQSTGKKCLERQHLTEEPKLPSSWVTMPCDGKGKDVTVHLVDLEITCSESEYQDVAKRFRQTVPSQNISSIARIQNPFLYQACQLRKQKMDKENEGDNERRLFHGTKPYNITKINTQGFDRSLSGSVNGAVYGAGVYFARDASYSKCYTSKTDVGSFGAMYLARVLVGQYCKGSSSMKKPPPKNPQQPEILFDSLVDKMDDPLIFVVYYDHQSYPEYLIIF